MPVDVIAALYCCTILLAATVQRLELLSLIRLCPQHLGVQTYPL
jgi:hypothetical protein